ncbi:Gfo/Idh/MocA family oxidoreductase [Paenibacillus polysaccharolyticus]|uniref:Gfo/Idh/MocA family protein n=1 Tax=Paenibacillus polysaccharolyticus TaxID=582692 RepID=UPI00209E2EBD|nr:Gfo/Idh/MocA family oxidoreductase [Paenibacillus polysaccharolyticus]MCP1133654.1 Gfo/Idh/MocA family oxidoreductase [Paenibacillus polysaccharolyticus]
MNKLNVGIIGCGAIAMEKHLPALLKLSDKVNVKGFASRNEEKAKKAADSVGNDARIYTNYKDMLQDPEIDVVHICTPNALHSSMTVEALEAGKHVMCEKPMAMNSQEAEEMVKAAERTGKKLTISYQNRFRKDSILLNQACTNGDLGEVYVAKAHAIRRRGVPTWGVFLNKEMQGGGALIDIGTHALDLTLWLMNNYEVESVTGVVHNKLRHENKANPFGPWDPDHFNVEESAFSFIKMKNGASIYLECSWALNSLDEREAMTTLSGTKGGAEMRRNSALGTNELIFNTEMYGNLVSTQLQNAAAISYISPVEETDADREMAQWIAAILENKDPVVEPRQALVVTQILEAIYRSAELNETIKF